MPAASLTTRAPARPFRSKRLLALAGDERLVEQIRGGNELAFEVAFERHGAGILSFCRHMLGSREEAEDAVQHTFAAAYRDIGRGGERSIALRPWLYTIARNRCLSVLRARREQAAELPELATEGLSDAVERRAELRDLLADVRELPEDQRAALLLAEAAGMSHAEVAQVLGCETGAVKGLVFRARSNLIERRTARRTPCGEIREQLATLRGGALRRNELRHHLRECPGCASYREEVRRQRQMLAAALPVAPSMGLKANVLAAVGIGGGGAGGAAVAAGAALTSLGSGAVVKVAVIGALATGGVMAGDVVLERAADERAPAPATAPELTPTAREDAAGASAAATTRGAETSRGRNTERRESERSRAAGRDHVAEHARGARANGAERGAHRDGTLAHGSRSERPDAAPRTAPAPPPRTDPPKREGAASSSDATPLAEATEPTLDAEAPAPEVGLAPVPAPSIERVKAPR